MQTEAIRLCIQAQYGKEDYAAARNELSIILSELAVARAVIAAFVYPSAPMTPAQRAAWEAWQNLQQEKETK